VSKSTLNVKYQTHLATGVTLVIDASVDRLAASLRKRVKKSVKSDWPVN